MPYRDELYMKALQVILSFLHNNITKKTAEKELAQLRKNASDELWVQTLDLIQEQKPEELKLFARQISIASI